MRRPIVVDLRNIYEPEELSRHGFVYECIGRGKTADEQERGRETIRLSA
jgi:UDPglucose 6-dehydrogenase